MAVSTTRMAAGSASSKSTLTSGSVAAPGTSRKKRQGQLSDDEILGIVTTVLRPETAGTSGDSGDGSVGNGGSVSGNAAAEDGGAAPGDSRDGAAGGTERAGSVVDETMSSEAAKALEANPQLRQVLADTQAYRAVFASPAAAQDAKNQLDELDGMFFSSQPGDHAALAARMHELSPEAFQGFAKAVQAHAAKVNASGQAQGGAANAGSVGGAGASVSPGKPQQLELFPSDETEDENMSGQVSQTKPRSGAAPGEVPTQQVAAQTTAAPSAIAATNDPRRAAQVAFFNDTNAAAVEQILGTIQSQVNQLLPDSVPEGTRNRIIGEVYRELDSTLRANRQLGKQLREAFQAGAGDAAHQRAIVTLVAGRAKQALPSVAKRVIGEWTQHIVAANRERVSRREAASKRVDIAGAGGADGVNRKPMSARDLNYRKLSDADILNL
ncbi:MAG TPA: hypothetical protein VGU63_03370 [Candidatus Acidoferrales bacterium]|nr:hypothetical protein [Candidatus Acidoferrales bacterium]